MRDGHLRERHLDAGRSGFERREAFVLGAGVATALALCIPYIGNTSWLCWLPILLSFGVGGVMGG